MDFGHDIADRTGSGRDQWYVIIKIYAVIGDFRGTWCIQWLSHGKVLMIRR